MRAIIVGAGLMGRWHANYGKRAGAEIVAVVDRELAAAERLAREVGAKAYTADDDWISRERPDVVHVCTPPSAHVVPSRAALEGGASAIVEKPVAATEAEVSELSRLAERHGRMLVPVHQFPFQAGFRELRANLASLGRVRSVEFVTFTAGADGRTGEQRREVLLEILPHAVSLFRALGFSSAVSELRCDRFDEDALELSAHPAGTRLFARIDLRSRPTRNELTVAGEQGTAMVDLFHGFAGIDRASLGRRSKLLRPFRVSASTFFKAGTNLTLRSLRREPAYPGLVELLRETYDAVRSAGRPPIHPDEAVEAAALTERLRESTR
jgi:predicted dehydrogenase